MTKRCGRKTFAAWDPKASALSPMVCAVPSQAVVTTPRGYKVEGLAFEDDVKVCGISVAAKPDVQIG